MPIDLHPIYYTYIMTTILTERSSKNKAHAPPYCVVYLYIILYYYTAGALCPYYPTVRGAYLKKINKALDGGFIYYVYVNTTFWKLRHFEWTGVRRGRLVSKCVNYYYTRIAEYTNSFFFFFCEPALFHHFPMGKPPNSGHNFNHL